MLALPQLCLATGTGGSIEGLVSSEVLGPGLKPIKNVSTVAVAANEGEGFGPKVLAHTFISVHTFLMTPRGPADRGTLCMRWDVTCRRSRKMVC